MRQQLTMFVFMIAVVGCGELAAAFPKNSGKITAIPLAAISSRIYPPKPKQPITTVEAAVFSPAGDRLLVSFVKKMGVSQPPSSAKFVLYEIPSGKILWVTGVAEGLSPIAIFPGNKSGLVYRNKSLELWDLERGALEQVIFRKNHEFMVAVNLVKNFALTTALTEGMRVWNMATWELAKEPLPKKPQPYNAYSPDGRILRFSIPAKEPGMYTHELWDLETNQLLNPALANYWPNASCISPDGKWIASFISSTDSANPDKTIPRSPYVVVCPAHMGKVVKTFKVDSSLAPRAMTFTGNGRYLVVGGSYWLKSFDLEKGCLEWEANIAVGANKFAFSANKFAFSADGRFALTAGGAFRMGSGLDMELKLWDLKTGAALRRLDPVH